MWGSELNSKDFKNSIQFKPKRQTAQKPMMRAEVRAALFRGEGREKGRGWGEDGLLLNPLLGMFVVFGLVYPRVWFTRVSGRKSIPRGDARTASITPGLRL